MKVIFELIKSFEFDILLDDKSIRGKIELFQNLEKPELFRFRTYEVEIFHLTPTFPQNEKGQSLHFSDELLWTERSFPAISNDKKEFAAKDVNEAIKYILAHIESFYQHVVL